MKTVLQFLNFDCRPVPENKWVEVGKAILFQIPVILLCGTMLFVGLLLGGIAKTVLGVIGLLGWAPVAAWFGGFSWFRPRPLGILIGMLFIFFSWTSICLWTIALLKMTVGTQNF